MRKLALLSFVLAFTALAGINTFASAYTADDKLIDEMFTLAPETANSAINALSLTPATTSFVAADKTAPVALLLDFFLGGFGVHRFYLGTEVLSGLGYPLTCGGFFGLMPLVDFVVLIINIDDISPYIDNPKFFMW